MIALVLLGAGVGLGTWLCLRGLSARPARLRTLQLALDRPGVPVADRRPLPASFADRAGHLALRLLLAVGDRPERRRQMLRLVERSPEQHALAKLAAACGGLVSVLVLAAGMEAMGTGTPTGLLVVAAVGLAAGGFVLPDFRLREEAARRQQAFRHALSAYLDLVNVILAGGGGIETSLHAAAEAGDGFSFSAIRGTLDRARLTGRSPWASFAELGDVLGIAELRELAASVELAGSHGARIRASLAAKADSLRAHQVAEIEAAAEAATERMTIPVAVLLLGFLVFVAYPAVQEITTVTNTVP